MGPTTTTTAFRALSARQLATHVAVGMGAASFWRGAWYMLDDHLFPDDKWYSAMSSLGLGTLGMAASQGLVARAEAMAHAARTRQHTPATIESTASWSLSSVRNLGRTHTAVLAVARFGALYTIAVSCVLVWRGTWLGWDCLYEHSIHRWQNNKAPLSLPWARSEKDLSSEDGEGTMLATTPVMVKSTDPGHATHSGLLSHCVAVGLLLGTGLFASVLAPPAAVSVIRDLAVRATGSPSSSSFYQGPAQRILDQWWSSSSSSTSAKSFAAVQRSISTHGPLRSKSSQSPLLRAPR